MTEISGVKFKMLGMLKMFKGQVYALECSFYSQTTSCGHTSWDIIDLVIRECSLNYHRPVLIMKDPYLEPSRG